MVFTVCGLNYNTTPLPVREQLTLSAEKQQALLQTLVDLNFINEALVISTCNRIEFYADTDSPDLFFEWLQSNYFASAQQEALYSYTHLEAIKHTLRVVTGSDSMMIGEREIFGQMKQAYQQACQANTLKSTLKPLFEYIFSASKRIRNKSRIDEHPVSIAYGAVQLIGTLFPAYQSLKVLLIGAGATSSLAAKYLYKYGVRTFYIASRTAENALELANTFNGCSLSISEIPYYLEKADVVISATACPFPFINQQLVQHALTERQYKPMFFLDLAVPRDIEANVGELPHVHLYNIDDLHTLVNQGIAYRQGAALHANKLIDEELKHYERWHRSRQVKEAICTYRTHMQTLADQEFLRAQQQLQNGSDQEIVLRNLCNRLVKKLTHHPTVGLKRVAGDGREELLDLVHYLFNSLDEPTTV